MQRKTMTLSEARQVVGDARAAGWRFVEDQDKGVMRCFAPGQTEPFIIFPLDPDPDDNTKASGHVVLLWHQVNREKEKRKQEEQGDA